MDLKQHAEEKERLLSQYERILDSDKLLEYDVKKEDIEQRIQNLRDEKFIVSICGQMNSGKSTLLNSYIFGDLVLPFYDTTQTAKLTVISYSDKPYFEPVFYNQEEWEQVTSSFKKSEENYKEFEESLKLAKNGGVNLNEILDKRRIKKIDDLTKLTEYVAIPSNGGFYSPFVNFVNLYYPNELLKEVTIVDTPGINDPNLLRERITLDWVKKSDAVLYVTYAKGAFTEDDYKFIDKNLIHIPRENMIIAVNKSDTVEDTESIGQWLDSLSQNNKFLKRKIFDKQTPRVFVSSLGELVRKMTEKGIDLPHDLKFYHDSFKEGLDFTKSERNSIEKLGKVIQEKLIEGKGNKLIESHKEFVRSLFERIVQHIDLQLESNGMSQSDFSKSELELQNELDKIKEQIEEIERETKTLDSRKRRLFAKLSNKQERDLIEVKKSILNEFVTDLNNFESIEALYDGVNWSLKSSFENHIDLLANSFRLMTESFDEKVKEEIDEFVDKMSRYKLFSKDFIKSSFDLSTHDVCRDFRRRIDRDLSREVVKEMIEEVTSWWTRNVRSRKGKEVSISHLKSESKKIIDEQIDSVQNLSNNEVREHVNKVFEELFANAKSINRLRHASIKESKNKLSDKENSLKKLKKVEQELKQTKIEIKKIEEEITA